MLSVPHITSEASCEVSRVVVERSRRRVDWIVASSRSWWWVLRWRVLSGGLICWRRLSGCRLSGRRLRTGRVGRWLPHAIAGVVITCRLPSRRWHGSTGRDDRHATCTAVHHSARAVLLADAVNDDDHAHHDGNDDDDHDRRHDPRRQR